MYKPKPTHILRLIAFAVIALVSALSPAAAQQKLVIGAIMYARDSQYWQQIEKGMKDAAAKSGVDLQFGINRRQLPVEAQVVEDFVTRKVDVIVTSILDKTASATVLKRAKDAGIMVIEYNTLLADESISAHTVGVDQKELATAVGKEMRKYVDSKLGGSAAVGLITLPLINPQMPIRKAGILAPLEGAKITIVAEVAGATPEEGANGFDNILQKNPNTQIIACSNSGTIAGAAAAAKRANNKVKLYGIDMSLELAAMLLDPASNVEAVSDQQPYRIGYLAIETAVRAKKGEKMDRAVMVPAKIYSKAEPNEVKEYINLIKSLSN